MGFQKKFNIYPSGGLSGQFVSLDGFVPTPVAFMSDGTVKAGSFVFLKNDKPGYATKTQTSGTLLGFATRAANTFLNVPLEEHTDTYPKNSVLTVAQRGQFYYELPVGASNVKSGQNVIVDPANGNVTFNVPGTANDTGWTVWLLDGAKTAKAGDLVIIQNIGLNNKPAGA